MAPMDPELDVGEKTITRPLKRKRGVDNPKPLSTMNNPTDEQ